jgi:hypothetical protein
MLALVLGHAAQKRLEILRVPSSGNGIRLYIAKTLYLNKETNLFT